MKKIALTFFRDWYDAISENVPKDKQLECYNALFRYAFYDEPITDGIVKMATALMCSSIDREKEKAEAIAERNRNNGKLGGRPKAETQITQKTQVVFEKPKKPKKPTLLEEQVQEQEQVQGLAQEQEHEQQYKKENISKRKSALVVFSPPTIADVEQYAQDKQLLVDAEYFVNYYTANGWKVGKSHTPMKNWRAALSNWAKNENRYGTNYNQRNSQRDQFMATIQTAMDTMPD